ncbi:MAG: hypothetical protein WC389_18670 [Lutibacter sp.]|jgi:hypothetical protein
MIELRYLNKLLETLSKENSPIREPELFLKAKIIDLGRFKDRHIFIGKLLQDKYVEIIMIENELKNKVEAYSITFEGVIFIKKGGYTKQYKREKTSKVWQIIQIWAIFLGSVFALIYCGIQIWEYLNLKELIVFVISLQ